MKKSEVCIRENIKNAFSAFAYEHSGEMLSPKRKTQLLSENKPENSIGNSSKEVDFSFLNKLLPAKRIIFNYAKSNKKKANIA